MIVFSMRYWSKTSNRCHSDLISGFVSSSKQMTDLKGLFYWCGICWWITEECTPVEWGMLPDSLHRQEKS